MNLATLIQQANRIFRNMVLGNEDFKIVANRDEPSIKHPMHGSGKSQSVVDGVRPFRSDRLNVRRLNFGTTSSID